MRGKSKSAEEPFVPSLNPYNTGLEACAANYTPLSPLSLLARSAAVYPKRVAVIHGGRRLSWSQVYERCCRLASALTQHGNATQCARHV
jgi:fatty-acyl-CoA synthase